MVDAFALMQKTTVEMQQTLELILCLIFILRLSLITYWAFIMPKSASTWMARAGGWTMFSLNASGDP
ncbi:hypothetical protein [Croceicoccus marinus]|uniref:hypothetical protein n=1 Tax=Croceicoccus marinus TaxID=450378 RepID=UPI00082EC1CF|nr:hypothetical protein [Croceicoccus marinus]